MPDIIQEQPDLVSTPESAEPTAQPAEADAPLSEHIAKFTEGGDQTDADGNPAPPTPKRGRHRAKSQQASPEDVPRIRALTAEKKALEERLAALEARTPPAPEPATPTYVPPTPPSGDTFTDPEPELEKYLAEGKTYEQYIRDLGKFDRKKEAWEAKQAEAATRTKGDTEAYQRGVQQRAAAYGQQLGEYLKANPAHVEAFKTMPNVSNPLIMETVWSLDNAPAAVYALLTTPGLFQEFHFLTEGKPLSAANVAFATDWLRARVQAGSTGAAVRESSPTPPAPRPPTPVRTRPMPPTDAAPGDGASLMEHQRYFKTAR